MITKNFGSVKKNQGVKISNALAQEDGASVFTTYLTKSLLDGVAAVALGAGLGIGVLFSVIPLFLLYQGDLTLIAQLLGQTLSPAITDEMTPCCLPRFSPGSLPAATICYGHLLNPQERQTRHPS